MPFQIRSMGVFVALPLMGACSGSPAAQTGAEEASGGSTSGASASAVAASAEAGAPVSFQNDLLPKLEHGCGLSSSCHQDPVLDPTMQRVFLGCDMNLDSNCVVASPGPQVYKGLMGMSQEDPSMPLVTPGNPSKSFLQYKVDGNLSGLQCTPVSSDPILQNAPSEPQPAQACGVAMPLGGQVSTDLSNAIRSWITAGAPNN